MDDALRETFGKLRKVKIVCRTGNPSSVADLGIINIQAARQSGLSVVYAELLDFSGDEIYFHAEPTLAGKTYGDSLLAYNDSTVIGIERSNEKVNLNPASNQ